MLTPQTDVILKGINALWLLFLLWWSSVLLFVEARSKRTWHTVLMVLLAALSFGMLQCHFLTPEDAVAVPVLGQLDKLWTKLPCTWVTAFCAGLTVLLAILTMFYRRWARSHISYQTFREAVNRLPAGVCCYREDGLVILKNQTMEQLCHRISGQALLNGFGFNEAVFTLPEVAFRRERAAENMLLLFDDGTAYAFSCATVQGDKPLHMLTAMDVTQEYSRTQALHERKQLVEQLNERMVNYQREILALIASQEVLNAKVKIHNELGASLLATKRLLLQGTDEDKPALLRMIRQNLDFLKQDALPTIGDEYQLILHTAQELGLKVDIAGELPQAEPLKHIAATAIHECCTNTIRHAGGTTLWVQIERNEKNVTIQLRNNGKQPEAPVTEKGGLSSLRRLVDHIHGEMVIETVPVFRLILTLPNEVITNVLSSADR